MKQLSLIENYTFDKRLDQLCQSIQVPLADVRNILDAERFDVRRRSYETYDTFLCRKAYSIYALNIDYYDEQKWCSIQEKVEIAPKGESNRIPQERKFIPSYDCHVVMVKDVQPSDWQMPPLGKTCNSREIPARITYIPQIGDVFLSRFKQPPGKSMIYLSGQPLPTYISSNFILLRARRLSPFALLSFLKSSFCLCQLNKIILRQCTTAELYIENVPQIALPKLSHKLEEQLDTCCRQIIDAEQIYRQYQDIGDGNSSDKNYQISIENLNNLSIRIDELIMNHIHD